MKWFIYDNETYYPDATIVEAATAEGALEAYQAEYKSTAYNGIAVFPMDALALWVCERDVSAIDEVLDKLDASEGET